MLGSLASPIERGLEHAPVATTSEDRDEIRDLYARYCLFFDQGAAADWAAMYTEDGEFVGSGQHLRGRAALEEFLAGLPAGTRHRITANHVIDIDGDRAVCTSSVLLLDGGAIASSGRAVDQLRRVDGTWRIAHRSFTPDATAPNDPREG
jgi:uncharacterized protein (TIGR02246 family)